MTGITALLQQHTKSPRRRLAVWAALLLLILNNASITQQLGFVDSDSDSFWYENPLALTIPPYDPPSMMLTTTNMKEETANRRLGLEDLVTIDEIPYGLGFKPTEKDVPEDDDIRELRRRTGPLRCATFGGSDTWGSMKLMRRGRDKSYAYRLGKMCNGVDNYGFFSQGPNYAQACLQSMIDDDKQYDLITLDFDENPAEVRNLAERLRRRFPKAEIIILDRYLPAKVIYSQGNKQIPMSELRNTWGKQNRRGYISKDQFFKALRTAKRLKVERHGKFGDMLKYRHSMKTEYGQIDRNLNAHTISLGDEKELEQSMIDTFDYYTNDGLFLSEPGHTHLARTIRQKAWELDVQRNDEVGDWGDGDICDVWFNSGETNLKLGPNLQMINYDTLRYALEIPPEGGWIEITSPFKGGKRRLWASYVVTPGLEQIHSSAYFSSDSGDINRHVNTKAFNNLGSIMTPKTSPLGKIGEGKHRIFIAPENNGKKPFWLVGLSITDAYNKYDPTEYGFTMTFWNSETHNF